jgi:hypothetical protein
MAFNYATGAGKAEYLASMRGTTELPVVTHSNTS